MDFLEQDLKKAGALLRLSRIAEQAHDPTLRFKAATLLMRKAHNENNIE